MPGTHQPRQSGSSSRAKAPPPVVAPSASHHVPQQVLDSLTYPVKEQHEADPTTQADPAQQLSTVEVFSRHWWHEICYWLLTICTCGGFAIVMRWFPLTAFFFRFKPAPLRHARKFVVTTKNDEQHIVDAVRLQLSDDVSAGWPLDARSFRKASTVSPPSEASEDVPGADLTRVDKGKEKDKEKGKEKETRGLLGALASFHSSHTDTAVLTTAADRSARPELVTYMFRFRCIRYALNLSTGRFEEVYFETCWPPTFIHNRFGDGIESDEIVKQRRALFGECVVDVPIPSVFELLVDEILTPFYLFQIFSVIIWVTDEYVQYAIAIAILTIVSTVLELTETRRNYANLRKIGHHNFTVNAFRGPIRDNHTHQKRPLLDRQVEITTQQLVPGDLFEVVGGMTLPCDAILLTGSCLINESMLTGESVPVMKHYLPFAEGANREDRFKIEQDRKCTLYAGTKVIQTRFFGRDKVVAVVARTGFSTTQGRIMRSLLYPRPTRFNFTEESFKFVAVLGCAALVGSGITLYLSLKQQLAVKEVVIRCLDLFTDAVPPALPAAMTIGTEFALSRLKRTRVTCISPTRVNVSGQICVLAFDKTGTLTEEGLDFVGCIPSVLSTTHTPTAAQTHQPQQHHLAVPSASAHSSSAGKDSDESPASSDANATALALKGINRTHQSRGTPTAPRASSARAPAPPPATLTELSHDMACLPPPLLHALATCHSLTMIEGVVTGDPIDLLMFNATGWELEEPEADNTGVYDAIPAIVRPKGGPSLKEALAASGASDDELLGGLLGDDAAGQMPIELGILRRFDFSSALQRMSVIVKHPLASEMMIFCKGSPEKISELCAPWTVPLNFEDVVHTYTKRGMRVLAIGGRTVRGLSYMQSQVLARHQVETGLCFLGLLVFANKLKEDTLAVMQELRKANCHCLMATGDNPLTAVAVARECGLIDRRTTHVIMGDVFIPKEESRGTVGQKQTLLWTKVEHIHHTDPHPSRRPSAAPPSRNPLPTHAEEEAEGDSPANGTVPVSTHSSVIDKTAAGTNCDTQDGTPVTPKRPAMRAKPTDSAGHRSPRHKDGHSAAGRHTVSLNIVDLLKGEDPREFTVVITGRAFRHLKYHHETEVGTWWPRPPPDPPDAPPTTAHAHGITPMAEQQAILRARTLSASAVSPSPATHPHRGPGPSLQAAAANSAPSFASDSHHIAQHHAFRTPPTASPLHLSHPQPTVLPLPPPLDPDVSTATFPSKVRPAKRKRVKRKSGLFGGRRRSQTIALGHPPERQATEMSTQSPIGVRRKGEPAAAAVTHKSSGPGPVHGLSNVQPPEYGPFLYFRVRRPPKARSRGRRTSHVAGGTSGGGQQGDSRDREARGACESAADGALAVRFIDGYVDGVHQVAKSAEQDLQRPLLKSDALSDALQTHCALPATPTIATHHNGHPDEEAPAVLSPIAVHTDPPAPAAHQHSPAEDTFLRMDTQTDRLGEHSGGVSADGEEWYEIPLFEYVLRNSTVFARMSPDDKEQLVYSLQSLPHHPLVAMCGDGANDCAALKGADIGVALSDEEASIAAPFTSAGKTIRSVVDVLKEGRAALVNSYQNFKFIVLYSFIQFSSVIIVYYYQDDLTDSQFLYVDLITILPLICLMSRTGTSGDLPHSLPPGSLVSPPIMTSVIGQGVIQLCFMLVATAMLVNQPWFPTQFRAEEGNGKHGAVDTVIFSITNLQFIYVVIALSHGHPWRKGFVTNLPYTVAIVVLLCLGVSYILLPGPALSAFSISRWLKLRPLPYGFRCQLAVLSLANFCVTALYERLLISVISRHTDMRRRAVEKMSNPLPSDPSSKVTVASPS